ncbi:MAG: DUF2332 domain-containing protein [Sphingomonadaceae bacterium]
MAQPPHSVIHMRSVPDALEWQATHAEEAGAACTARIIRALLPAMGTDTATARAIAGWQGLALEDAMPLRITAGLHFLALSGRNPQLPEVYAGLMTDQTDIDSLVRDMFIQFDDLLLPWLDHPPQTNEAGRSASIMAALIWLSSRIGSQFALYEIGASAGVNTMMDRYHYNLGGVEQGPDDSPMQIMPEWRGLKPPDDRVKIVSIKGCDRSPVDLTDPDAALRLKSYVWPEMRERMARIDAATRLARIHPPDISCCDAASWVPSILTEPQQSGMARVLFHSIVWQYIPEAGRQTIHDAMMQAGKKASPQAPLAWVMLETNRETFKHELRVRYWPGPDEWIMLAHAHPHGAWVKWSPDNPL